MMRLRSLSLIGITLLSSSGFALAQYTNGQNAVNFWGQVSFTSAAATTPPSAGTLAGPFAITVDSATGKFFVADTGNNRVLRYSSSAAYISGAGAEAVFGQADFASKASDISAEGMNAPQGLVVDSGGRLWVSDTGNNRVLCFNNASTISGATSGTAATADGVLGQPDLTTNTASTIQSGMKNPLGLAVDSQDSLYVADAQNNRILKFVNPSAKISGGANADGVLGQGNNFNSGTAGTTAATLNFPGGLTVDASNNLWVVDINNQRALKFSSVTTISNGASASVVLGQPDFTTGTPVATSQVSFYFPTGITTDSAGRIYVADTFNNRVLVFENPGTEGAAASFVLGQTNFTAPIPSAATTQAGENAPRSVLFYSNQLWVAESGNNRVISYALTAGTPSFTIPKTLKISNTKKAKTTVVYLNTTGASDVYTVGATIPSSTNKLATITFTYNGVDVTSALKSNSLATSLFAPGQSQAISVKIKPKAKAANGGSIKVTFTAVSKTSSSNTAQGTLNGKYKKTN
jgi:sugar lactone lactonase YvrE